ncbi:YeeE/YedE thiosulfate transporter family protein [Desulfobacca acetoxidans]
MAVNLLKHDGWNPYMAGALSGLAAIFSVWITGKYFGASTTFSKSAGMLEKIFSPERVAGLAYFQKEIPQIDWQWMFVFGIFLGSLIAATTDGSFHGQAVPDMWYQRFGPHPVKRGLAAFGGGIVAILGARLVGGCPSGHGLSGSMQLAVSSFIVLICFFLGGVLMARLLYGRGETS